jgi:hypothetical protein
MTAIQFSRDHACAIWPCVSPPFARVHIDPSEPSDVVAPRATTSSDRSVGDCATCGQFHLLTLHASSKSRVFVDGGRRSRRASAQRMQTRWRAAQNRCDGEIRDSGLARHWREDSGVPPQRVHPPRGLCRFRPRPRLAARPSASRPAHAYISGD